MKSVRDEKKLKKINANPFSTKLVLLEEDIDPDANYLMKQNLKN